MHERNELGKNGTLQKLGGGLLASGDVLVLALIAVGALLAYVLPMIPYVITLFAVLSWFTSIFIAMVAAPLWAVSHATPGGHEAFGSGANGYVLLMSVALRPALTILAMFGSLAILFGIDRVFNMGYQTAFVGAQTSSMIGLFGSIVSVVMYAVLSLILVYGCYRLVQTVPDAILQWIGGRDDDSIGVEKHSDKVIGAYIATRAVGGAASGAFRKGWGEVGGKGAGEAAGNAELSAGNSVPGHKQR